APGCLDLYVGWAAERADRLLAGGLAESSARLAHDIPVAGAAGHCVGIACLADLARAETRGAEARRCLDTESGSQGSVRDAMGKQNFPSPAVLFCRCLVLRRWVCQLATGVPGP